MLDRQYDLSPFQEAINQSNHLAILFSTSATLDIYSAGIALALGLQKTGRTTSLISATPPDSSLSQLLPTANNIQTQLSSGDLVMSFPYQEGSIDKVSYHIDKGKFYLVVKPKAGFPPITQETLNFNQAGPEPDYYLVLNTSSLEELGNLYKDHPARFTKENLIQFSTTKILATPSAGVSIADEQASSLSEVIFRTFQGLSIQLDAPIASALILGIEAQTAGLSSPNLSPDVFTIIAECLKAGGTRYFGQAMSSASSTTSSSSAKSTPVSQSLGSSPSGSHQPIEPALQPITLEPMTPAVSQTQSPQEPSWVRPVSSA